MDLDVVVRQCLSGLSVASVLFLIAAGLNLIWGVLRIMNFATGSVYMLGAYGALVSIQFTGGTNWGFVLTLIGVPLLVSLAGVVVEVTLLRRTYPRDDEDQQFLVTLALSYVVTGAVVAIFGTKFRTVRPPAMLEGGLTLGGAVIPIYTLFTICIGILVAVGVWLLLYRTRLGGLTRAAVNDREMVAILGINVGRIYTAVFGLGIALGALGGVLIAPVTAVTTHLDLDILVEAFIITVTGGLGNMAGALAAALVIGLLQSFLALVDSKLVTLAPYFVMAVVLTARALRDAQLWSPRWRSPARSAAP